MNCFDFSVIIRFVLKTSIRCRLVTFGVYLSSVTLFLADEMSNDEAVNLRSLSIEELLDVKVTSVSKKSESVSRSAAAITVISQEDIRRSGAMSLPEAIRLAPGMQVAAIDAANCEEDPEKRASG